MPCSKTYWHTLCTTCRAIPYFKLSEDFMRRTTMTMGLAALALCAVAGCSDGSDNHSGNGQDAIIHAQANAQEYRLEELISDRPASPANAEGLGIKSWTVYGGSYSGKALNSDANVDFEGSVAYASDEAGDVKYLVVT